MILEIKHGMKCNFIPTSQGRKLDGEVQEGSWTPLLKIAQCALLAAVTEREAQGRRQKLFIEENLL